MSVNKDIEDDDFEALLADKRHKELSGTLKTIAMSLSKEKDDKAVVDAINGQGEKVAALVKAIENIPKPEKPEVNVELNQDKVISSLREICTDIVASNKEVIAALENRLLPDSFQLVKGYGGVTESVKVNYKAANLINNKK